MNNNNNNTIPAETSTKFAALIFVALVVYSLGVSNAKQQCEVNSQAAKIVNSNKKPSAILANKTIEKPHKWSPKNSASKAQIDFVKRFSKTAQQEQIRYGIPASITLAQGILESGSGTNYLSRKANNFFGVKCFEKKCKVGHCVHRADDHNKDFFKVYKSAWESFRMHSKFLHGKRYKSLYNNDLHDYRAWAYGLKKCGYATDPNYAQKLIKLIEKLNLNHFDLGTEIKG